MITQVGSLDHELALHYECIHHSSQLKLHYFTSSNEKLAKIKNRRSSLLVELNLTSSDDRRLANWRIIIDDIQRGKIAGLGGWKQSWQKSPLSLLDSLLLSSPTTLKLDFFCGSFGLDPLLPASSLWPARYSYHRPRSSIDCSTLEGACHLSFFIERYS